MNYLQDNCCTTVLWCSCGRVIIGYSRGFRSHPCILWTNANSACYPLWSVNVYQWNLEVNGHTTQYIRPIYVVLQLRLHGVRLRANEAEMSAAYMGPFGSGRTLLYCCYRRLKKGIYTVVMSHSYLHTVLLNKMAAQVLEW